MASNNDGNNSDFGFILLRHVRDAETNQYWQHSLECIRRHYPRTPVLLIDDNSQQQYVTPSQDAYCTIIQSEYPGRGEILPYYYFWKLRPFERAVFLHDSVFLQQPLTLSSEPIEWLWFFHPHTEDVNIFNHHMAEVLAMCQHLTHSAILKSFYRSSTSWFGCFGAMANFTWSAIDQLQTEYNIFVLLDHIQDRRGRMTWERILPLVCYLNPKKQSANNTENNSHSSNQEQTIPTMIGNIFHKYFSYTYAAYNRDKERDNRWWRHEVLVKVWTGR